jgi:membrane protein DedA with SNARE-associated domain
MNVGHLVSTYGYWAVFALVGMESLGIPVPGETMLVTAGAYAGHTGRLSVWAIFAVAAAAAIVGDNIGYWIGNKGGYPVLRRYGHYIRFDESKMKVGRYLFDRHGGKVVFFGRFVSILRTYAAFLAGTNRMHWPRFTAFNAAGGILWAALFAFLSYQVGSALLNLSTTLNLAIGGVAVAAIVTVLLVVRRQTGRLQAVAEAAYPGPLDG